MSPTFAFLGAETATNGFGIDWTVLAVVLVGVVALMFVIRGIGMLAASSLPEPGAKLAAKNLTDHQRSAAASVEGITPELVAVLTAAASVALGSNVRIREISAGKWTLNAAGLKKAAEKSICLTAFARN